MLLLMTVLSLAVVSCSSDDNAEELKYPVPTVSGVSPSEGLPTSVVTITGTNFGNERTDRIGRVYFGGVEATDFVSWSDTQIQVRVPETGVTGPVSVWIWKSHAESTAEFTCIPGAKITSVSSDADLLTVGSTLRMYGERFEYFISKGITKDDVIVSFTSADGVAKGVVSEFNKEYLDVVIPGGARSCKPTVQFGNLQTIEAPAVDISGYFNHLFTHHDVYGGYTYPNTIGLHGKSNPCSYGGAKGGNPLVFEYKNGNGYGSGFDDATEVLSFTLWDSVVDDWAIFNLDLLEENDYYIYFGTKGKSTGDLQVSCGANVENLSETMTGEVSATGYGWPNYQYEFGPFHLKPGTNYFRFDFVSAAVALTDIYVTNERETEGEIRIP